MPTQQRLKVCELNLFASHALVLGLGVISSADDADTNPRNERQEFHAGPINAYRHAASGRSLETNMPRFRWPDASPLSRMVPIRRLGFLPSAADALFWAEQTISELRCEPGYDNPQLIMIVRDRAGHSVWSLPFLPACA
jgi:hypothetical protein